MKVVVRKVTLRTFGAILSIQTADYTYLLSFQTPTVPLLARHDLRELATDHRKLEFTIIMHNMHSSKLRVISLCKEIYEKMMDFSENHYFQKRAYGVRLRVFHAIL